MATDPSVSKRKFDREVGKVTSSPERYETRGIWILHIEYPLVVVAFATPNSQPITFVPFAVEINFNDFDARPPSVRFVHPVNRTPLDVNKLLPTNLQGTNHLFPRLRPLPPEAGAGFHIESLVQAFEPNHPFLCLAGVREYHEGPAHSGDSWWLHRGTGEGSLPFLLDNIWRYGVKHIAALSAQIGVTFNAFAVNPNILQDI